MRPSSRSIVRGALTTALLGSLIPAQADEWRKHLAAYNEWMQRPALHKRTIAREKLAATGDPRALELLIKSYAKPEEPIEQNRYLIASIAVNAFRRAADPAVFESWRKKHAKPEDAWMWFLTLEPFARDLFDVMGKQVLGKGNAFLRAVALEAFAHAAAKGYEPENLAMLCLEILDALPKSGVDRALLTEGVAHVLLAVRRQVRGETWKPVAEALIRQFDEPATEQRTKVVLSRYFSKIFNVNNLGYESHWWRNELERANAGTKPKGGTTTSVPFYAIRTVGFRFVYVIDASDSMCRRVSDREKRDIGPTTGKQPKKDDGNDGGFVPKENELDWNRIITRFDVGREFVRQSLLSLQPEHSFAVVLFGDEAQTLKATPKLIPATPQNVRAAVAELEGMEQGPPKQDRPDGVLLGRTNLHAGLARAFEITTAGLTKREEYVDPKAMTEGCDSIFLLSDGAPSWDNWPAEDARDPEDQAGDPETGVQYANVPRLIFQGPYARPPHDYLAQDIQRMNLFRKAEIHCVGIGEANHHLLERIAQVGKGTALKIEGEKK
ncbi:MAG: hypothetical protein AB7I19_12950 [Planctomycetota bacterium]